MSVICMTSNLFVGDKKAAIDEKIVKNYGITHMIDFIENPYDLFQNKAVQKQVKSFYHFHAVIHDKFDLNFPMNRCCKMMDEIFQKDEKAKILLVSDSIECLAPTFAYGYFISKKQLPFSMIEKNMNQAFKIFPKYLEHLKKMDFDSSLQKDEKKEKDSKDKKN